MQLGMLGDSYKRWHCKNAWKLQLSRMLWWALYKQYIWTNLKLLQWKCQEGRLRDVETGCLYNSYPKLYYTEQHSWNPAAFPTCLKSWWFLVLQGSCKLYVVTVKLCTVCRNNLHESNIAGVALKIMRLCINLI